MVSCVTQGPLGWRRADWISRHCAVRLAGLNPYTNGRWMIRVRVMSKDKRTYRNAKGEGKLFNVLVADHTGDIRLTGFNEVLDQYYSLWFPKA